MARASIIQTNFTSGELSPGVALGRMDVAKYPNGVKRMENCVLTIQGGAYRRPGTRFVGEVKSSGVARLISFIYSRSQAYVIAAGAGYMWFYKNRARIGTYEVTTPYTADQLPEVRYVQKSDTGFFCHNDVYPQRLQRFGDSTWNIEKTPFEIEPFAEVGTMPNVIGTLSSGAVGSRTFTLSSGFFLASDQGRDITYGGGRARLTTFTNSTTATVTVINPFQSTTLPAGLWTLEGSPGTSLTPAAAGIPDTVLTMNLGADGFRAEDVGKYLSVNGGLARIFAYVSPTQVTSIVVTEIATAVSAPADSWSLNGNAWSATRGYPRAVTINKQRLYLANTYAYPQTVWGSVIRGYLSFLLGTNDDEGFAFELDGASNSPIMHLSPARKMLVLTEADEMSLTGSDNKAISPTNIDKNDESSAGCAAVRPIKVGNELLFASADGKKVHAMGYRYDIDGFPAPDRTVFANHISQSGIKEFSFEKQDSTLYAVRNDGVLAVCAYDIDQEVVGWGRWLTQGAVESITTIPTATAEDTYVVVARTIGGVLKRYIEVFDRDVMLDCAVVATSPSPVSIWTGLSHLEGKVVQIRADGAYAGQKTVSGGQVTLDRPASSVQIGLGYKALIELLQPELGSGGTTSQGNPVNVADVIVRVLDTQALVINGVEIDFRKFDTPVLDMPPPTVSGDWRSFSLNDEIYTTSQIIEQPFPAPFHILDVIRRLTIND